MAVVLGSAPVSRSHFLSSARRPPRSRPKASHSDRKRLLACCLEISIYICTYICCLDTHAGMFSSTRVRRTGGTRVYLQLPCRRNGSVGPHTPSQVRSLAAVRGMHLPLPYVRVQTSASIGQTGTLRLPAVTCSNLQPKRFQVQHSVHIKCSATDLVPVALSFGDAESLERRF